jgi:hypothetical protein
MNNKNNKCVFGYSVNTNTDTLISVSETIEDVLSTNPLFQTVSPSPAEVGAVLFDLKNAQLQCRQRNYSYIPTRNSLKRQLVDMMLLQCSSTNVIADGDPEVLRASGFRFEKERSHRPVPAVGSVISVTPSRLPDQIVAKAKPLKDITNYVFEVRQADGTVITHTSTRCKTVIAGVTPGMDIEVRVCGSNAQGCGNWSDYLKFATPRTSQNPSSDQNGNLKIA